MDTSSNQTSPDDLKINLNTPKIESTISQNLTLSNEIEPKKRIIIKIKKMRK